MKPKRTDADWLRELMAGPGPDELPFPRDTALEKAFNAVLHGEMEEVMMVDVLAATPFTAGDEGMTTAQGLDAFFKAAPPEFQFLLRSLFDPAPNVASEATATGVLIELNGWRMYIPEVVVSRGQQHADPDPRREGGETC